MQFLLYVGAAKIVARFAHEIIHDFFLRPLKESKKLEALTVPFLGNICSWRAHLGRPKSLRIKPSAVKSKHMLFQ